MIPAFWLKSAKAITPKETVITVRLDTGPLVAELLSQLPRSLSDEILERMAREGDPR